MKKICPRHTALLLSVTLALEPRESGQRDLLLGESYRAQLANHHPVQNKNGGKEATGTSSHQTLIYLFHKCWLV